MNSALAIMTVVLACAGAVTADIAPEAPNCSSGGYDLTPLAGINLMGADRSYNYILNLCGVVSSESNCETNGGAFCQYGLNPRTYQHVLTKWDTTGAWSTCQDAVNCPHGGFEVYFQNGDRCGGTTGANRAVTFQFACTPGSNSTTYLILPGPVTCAYVVVFNHEIGCSGNNGGGE